MVSTPTLTNVAALDNIFYGMSVSQSLQLSFNVPMDTSSFPSLITCFQTQGYNLESPRSRHRPCPVWQDR